MIELIFALFTNILLVFKKMLRSLLWHNYVPEAKLGSGGGGEALKVGQGL